MANLRASQHALYRYMERVLHHDFSELKMLYAVEHGLPSINHIKEAHFMRWCENEAGSFGVFRMNMTNRVWQIMTPKQRNILKNNKNLQEKVVDIDNKITYVVAEDTIVTVLWNGTKKYEIDAAA